LQWDPSRGGGGGGGGGGAPGAEAAGGAQAPAPAPAPTPAQPDTREGAPTATAPDASLAVDQPPAAPQGQGLTCVAPPGNEHATRAPEVGRQKKKSAVAVGWDPSRLSGAWAEEPGGPDPIAIGPDRPTTAGRPMDRPGDGQPKEGAASEQQEGAPSGQVACSAPAPSGFQSGAEAGAGLDRGDEIDLELQALLVYAVHRGVDLWKWFSSDTDECILDGDAPEDGSAAPPLLVTRAQFERKLTGLALGISAGKLMGSDIP
jgi:hypothetical protein